MIVTKPNPSAKGAREMEVPRTIVRESALHLIELKNILDESDEKKLDSRRVVILIEALKRLIELDDKA